MVCGFFFPSGPFYVIPNVLTQTYLMLIFLPIISLLIDTRVIYKAWKKYQLQKFIRHLGGLNIAPQVNRLFLDIKFY